jgi:hypothetical protein
MHQVPPDIYYLEDDEDADDPDVRLPQRLQDRMVAKDTEFYDGDRDQDGDFDGSYRPPRAAAVAAAAAAARSSSEMRDEEKS